MIVVADRFTNGIYTHTYTHEYERKRDIIFMALIFKLSTIYTSVEPDTKPLDNVKSFPIFRMQRINSLFHQLQDI